VNRTESLILGILREAKDRNHGPLIRTVLHKFVYLADVYSAEETNGQTFTGQRWEFVHFGPFSGAVASAIDHLAASNQLFADTRESANDAEYVLYSPRGSSGESLRAIGLPSGVALRLDSDLHRYARDLPGLLDYVYFRTHPMVDAQPGQVLLFDQCEKISNAAYKPVPMVARTPKQLKIARQAVRDAFARRADHIHDPLPTGPYDEAYFQALAALDGEQLSGGLSGTAKISRD
jgi:hypothetical protein